MAVFLWTVTARIMFGGLLHGINRIVMTPSSGAPMPWQGFLRFCGIGASALARSDVLVRDLGVRHMTPSAQE